MKQSVSCLNTSARARLGEENVTFFSKKEGMEEKKKEVLHIHVEMCSVSVSFDAGLCTYLRTHTCLRARPRACGGRFDAFLSGAAPFAPLVFNDASREADSRRVERAAFDVSDYDITDVERRSGDPRSPIPPTPPTLPFTSQWHIIQKERRER